jgi:hypothetical protein
LNLKTKVFLGGWAALTILLGTILMSYHQPFRLPGESILSFAEGLPGHGRRLDGRWQVIHFLSGGCGCSQRVMRHLLQRRMFAGIEEQVVLIDGPEGDLPESPALIDAMRQQGFRIRRMTSRDIPRDAGLRGVPLLVIASPHGRIAYMGGYGISGDQDAIFLKQAISGRRPEPLPLLGCAVGARIGQTADPFHLKF